MQRVTLLTDFGTADGYVAAMKGVIASIAPDAQLDDVSHDLAQGDVEAAAWSLGAYWRLYPRGTVHLVVVDPGVGSQRRALAVRADGRLLVAPDNGVLSRVLHSAADVQAVHALESAAHRRTDVSNTFHGRDIFAPAAAHLAAGEPIRRMGPRVENPITLEVAEPQVVGEALRGQVVHVDRFGNLITNIPADALPDAASVEVEDAGVGEVRRTYSDVPEGSLLALIGSSGYLEVSERNGSAARRLGLGRGATVHVQRGGGIG